MAEIHIKFKIRINSAVARCGLAVLLLLSLVAEEMATESVNLTTYYPAPSGVYSLLNTAGNTYLARDGASNVGVGITAPLARLDIRGGDMWLGTGGNQFRAANAGGDPANHGSLSWYGLQLGNNGANFLVAGRTSPGGYFNFVVNNTLDFPVINGLTAMTLRENGRLGIGTGDPVASVDVFGTDGSDGVFVSRQAGCIVTPYGAGTTLCPGAHYATYLAGILNQYQGSVLVMDETGGGRMLCCPCPVGGCPLGL